MLKQRYNSLRWYYQKNSFQKRTNSHLQSRQTENKQTSYHGDNFERPPNLTKLDFESYNFTYPHLSSSEILRGCVVLSLCKWNWLVDNSHQLMRFSKKVLTRNMFEKLMRSTFYGQFVGGQTKQEIQNTINKFQKFGIRPILLFPVEEDTDSSSSPEKIYNTNKENILQTMNLVADAEPQHPAIQMKLTALFSAKHCEILSGVFPEPYEKPQVILDIAKALKNDTKVNLFELSQDQNDHLTSGLKRVREICQHALTRRITVMVDAEYTYLNPGIELISLAMMLHANKEFPWIFYTKQNNLKRTFESIKKEMHLIQELGVCYGVKLVRGAYLEKERLLAKTKEYPDPTNSSFEATSQMYHNSLEYIMNRICQNPGKVRIIIASHNEATVQRSIEIMNNIKMDPVNGGVCFGQVYGMCDHVSSVLGQHGYLIYKSIPIGGIEENLAYLSRRAFENRSILERAKKERQLLWKALRMRR